MIETGKTFYDAHFRKWQIIQVFDTFVDAKLVEYCDGFIPNTPQFKIFDIEGDRIKQSDSLRDIVKNIIKD